MAIDTKEIKKALDRFENDEFVDAKEILSQEIRKAKNDFLKGKLDLKGDIEPVIVPDDKKVNDED